MIKQTALLAFLCVTLCLACGGKNSTGSTVTQIDARFSSIQQKVFTPSCAVSGCHNGFETPTLVAGAAYNNIVNVPSSQGLDYIEPGDPDNSYLYRKIKGTGITGVVMPKDDARLSNAVIDSIRVWIQKGALNN